MSLKSVSPAAGYGEARQEAEKCPVNNGHRPTTQANVAVSSLAAPAPPPPQWNLPNFKGVSIDAGPVLPVFSHICNAGRPSINNSPDKVLFIR
jgi:hypothetical protein